MSGKGRKGRRRNSVWQSMGKGWDSIGLASLKAGDEMDAVGADSSSVRPRRTAARVQTVDGALHVQSQVGILPYLLGRLLCMYISKCKVRGMKAA